VAERLYRRALAIDSKAPDELRPGAAETLRNYADLLRQTGRDAEADEWQARADAIREMRAEEIN
jgi:hypothetical protein